MIYHFPGVEGANFCGRLPSKFLAIADNLGKNRALDQVKICIKTIMQCRHC